MAWPNPIETPEHGEEVEKEVRLAILACFLEVAGNDRFGFDSSHAHDRSRYPDSDTKWEEIAMIDDPDTEGEDIDDPDTEGDITMKTVRYFSVELIGQTQTVLNQWVLKYGIQLSFGLKDEYHSDATLNSSNELTACLVQFATYLRHNLNLGLNDSVNHSYLQTVGRGFVPSDAQGRPEDMFQSTLDVTLEVC